MRTDTKKFKNAVAVAIRKSRRKWNADRKTFAHSGQICGFCCEQHKESSAWNCCNDCEKLFFSGIDGECCVAIEARDSNTLNPTKWKRACTIMNKRFDKIAKLYGVDA